jgi:hypothetical protein
MSLDQPSGLYDVRDVAFCARCAEDRPGKWTGDPSKPMAFRCDACEWETTGVDA